MNRVVLLCETGRDTYIARDYATSSRPRLVLENYNQDRIHQAAVFSMTTDGQTFRYDRANLCRHGAPDNGPGVLLDADDAADALNLISLSMNKWRTWRRVVAVLPDANHVIITRDFYWESPTAFAQVLEDGQGDVREEARAEPFGAWVRSVFDGAGHEEAGLGG